MATSSWVQDAASSIQNVPLEEPQRKELLECLREIETIDANGNDQRTGSGKKLLEVLDNVANFVLVLANVADIVPPLRGMMIFGVLKSVLGRFLQVDIASQFTSSYKSVMSEPFANKCRATCRRIVYCVRYVQRMPLEPNDESHKRHLLQLLSSEFPIQDVLHEVLELGDKIKQMVSEANIYKFDELMTNIELYCNLTTYVELFLLHRLMIHKTYGSDTAPMDAVIEEHRNTDKTVLLFLYKPTRKTAKLYAKCYFSEWPNLCRFVARRDIYPEILDEISMKKFIMRPVRKPNKALTAGDNSDISVQESSQTAFEFRPSKGRNIFTINTSDNRFIKCKGINIRLETDRENEDIQEWYVLKVYPEQAMDDPTYMMWLPEDHCKCIGYASGVTNCYWYFKPGKTYLWTFHPA